MRTLIVSDLHLTDKFDEAKAAYLERLFSSFDHIILNGDFWDGERIFFDSFIQSEWKRLFPLLLEKKAVYIYGNHDFEEYADKRVSLFSVQQCQQYVLDMGEYSCFIEHGHQLFRTIDIALHLPRFILFGLTAIFQPFESLMVNHGSIHNIFIRISNKIMKHRVHSPPHQWYVCGHTHFPEIDEKAMYANSGFIQFGKATYLIATSTGLSLKTEWYK